MPEYPVLTPVLHGDELLGPGDTLTLELEDARPLQRDGSLAFIAEPAEPAVPAAPAKTPKRGGKGPVQPAEETGDAASDKTA